jgi:putative peptidoglycan lipid II flippase
MFLVLRRRLHGADGRRIASTIGRATVASVLSGAAAFAAAGAFAAGVDLDRPLLRLLQVTFGVVAGVLVFVGAALMMRVQEVDEVRNALLARFRR